MTCIAGLVHDGRVYMGGDSAGVSGMDLHIRADEKVFNLGPSMVLGFTSSFRMGQLLRYRLEAKPPDGDEDLHRWMCTEFVDRVRAVLADGGFRKRENEVEHGGDFLVGVRGTLFGIAEDFQVTHDRASFAAVGCGAEFARGALYASPRVMPAQKIIHALEAAEAMSAGVRGPFCIRSTAAC